MNSWYVLAKQDKRYKYNFYPVINKNLVFYNLKEAIRVRDKKQKFYKMKLIILKRTCQPLKV